MDLYLNVTLPVNPLGVQSTVTEDFGLLLVWVAAAFNKSFNIIKLI